MIDFPRNPDAHAEFVHVREQCYAHPPMPLPLDYAEGPQPLVTARWGWIQPSPDFTDCRATEGRVMHPGDVVTRVEASGNPLRQLAAELLKAADQADRDGLVPLGINLETQYFTPWSSYFNRNSGPFSAGKCALVAVTVRGIRREWLDANRESEEREILL